MSANADGHPAPFTLGAIDHLVHQQLKGVDEVLAFRPDHCSITVLESDGATLTLVEQGAEASTGVL